MITTRQWFGNRSGQWSRLFAASSVVILATAGIMMMAGCKNPDQEASEHPTFKTPPQAPRGAVAQSGQSGSTAPVSGGQTTTQGNTHF